jgi:hypothetical protein
MNLVIVRTLRQKVPGSLVLLILHWTPHLVGLLETFYFIYHGSIQWIPAKFYLGEIDHIGNQDPNLPA